MDNVRCNGTETRLEDCHHLDSDDCGELQGAGVVCRRGFNKFKTTCIDWIQWKFPNASVENITKFVNYFTKETKTFWNETGCVRKTILCPTHYKFGPWYNTLLPFGENSDSNNGPWNLSNCDVFQFFVCPQGACNFKSSNKLEFKGRFPIENE